MNRIVGLSVLLIVGCAHKEPEPPPKVLHWSDTTLGASARPAGAAAEPESAPSDEGTTPAKLANFIRGQSASVKGCYEKALKDKPELKGTVNVDFVLSKDGKVKKAKVSKTTVGDPALERCIVDTAKGWKFPQSEEDGVEFTYPFVFAAATEKAPAAEEPAGEADPLETQSAADLQKCYEKFAKGSKGKAVIAFAVMPGKKVGDVKMTDSQIKKPKFDACVVAAVKTWPFPPVKAKTEVKLPLVMDGEKCEVEAGEEEAQGGIDIPEAVQEKLATALKAKLAAMKCTDKAGKLSGQMGLGLRIGPDGKVVDAIVTQSEFADKPGAAAIDKCVIETAKKWSLTPLPKQIDIEIPVEIPAAK